MLILFTSSNSASKNIADKLVSLGFRSVGANEWELKGVRMLDTRSETVLDMPTNLESDCLLILSSHKSKNPLPMLTVHFPGNWLEAGMGGKNGTLNFAYASKLKQLYLALKETNSRTGLNWEVCIEADHHGPAMENKTPMIFIEIGSSEKEWDDPKAGETVASAIVNSLLSPNSSRAFFGAGGGHYSREFCKLINSSEWAVGHILPKYGIDEVGEDTLEQAIAKSVEKVEKVVMLKDSTNLKQKEKIRKFCEKKGLACEEI
ncbi:MAG: D-aminoacyl-tRNA deacylase [Candidatus Micrarchaeia archaeon]|jgi:D-aminoacyl-tRNA deacylase